jgi:hypothetical protein
MRRCSRIRRKSSRNQYHFEYSEKFYRSYRYIVHTVDTVSRAIGLASIVVFGKLLKFLWYTASVIFCDGGSFQVVYVYCHLQLKRDQNKLTRKI